MSAILSSMRLRQGHSKRRAFPSSPNLAAMQKEYEALQAQKEALYADYGKLKKKVWEYDVIKQNIDSILRQEKELERGKEPERG